MSNNLTMKRHATLVDQMAGTLGLDLEEKVLEGNLDPSSLTDAVLRCTGCSDPEGCGHWLNAHQGVQVESAPVMCRNSDIFGLLKAGKHV